MSVLIISDSILRGISARGAHYMRFRKTKEGYTKIRGMVRELLTLTIPLIQIVFGGWSPSEERLTEFQRKIIWEYTRGNKIEQIYLVTGINSVRGFLFDENLQTESQRKKTINKTVEGIRKVIDKLRRMFPTTPITYLGSSKLLTESSLQGMKQVNTNPKERNEDLDEMNKLLQDHYRKRFFNEMGHQLYRKPETVPSIDVINVFENMKDEHIKDMCGHLSPIGDEYTATVLNTIMN